MGNRAQTLVFVVFLAGCTAVSSLDSALPDSALVTDPRLLGEWVTQDEHGHSEHASVGQEDTRHYRFRYIDTNNDTSVLIMSVGRLGGRWLLDLRPTPDAENTIGRLFGIPIHFQLVLEIADSALRVARFDGDTLKAYLTRDRAPVLGYVILSSGDVLLTDPTDRLARGLAAYAQRPGGLTEWGILRRP